MFDLYNLYILSFYLLKRITFQMMRFFILLLMVAVTIVPSLEQSDSSFEIFDENPQNGAFSFKLVPKKKTILNDVTEMNKETLSM